MADRDKVIRALHCCAHTDGSDCMYCPYNYNDEDCTALMSMDVLELLKEQDAENGEWITIWREDDPYTSSHARCSVCNRVSERPLGGYCKWCGAKMNQEWGVDG